MVCGLPYRNRLHHFLRHRDVRQHHGQHRLPEGGRHDAQPGTPRVLEMHRDQLRS